MLRLGPSALWGTGASICTCHAAQQHTFRLCWLPWLNNHHEALQACSAGWGGLQAALTVWPRRPPCRALRRKLPMPVLLVWADGDVALGPQLLRKTYKYAEHLRVHVVADCSHWVQQDRCGWRN